MVNLQQYLAAGSTPGSKWQIWVREMFFFNVGSGEIQAADPWTLTFAGRISAAGYNGDLNFAIALGDGDKATLTINGKQAESATYAASPDPGSQLVVNAVFGSDAQSLTFKSGNGGRETWITLAGLYAYDVHLSPSS